jgi:hypothetical protein
MGRNKLFKFVGVQFMDGAIGSGQRFGHETDM